MAERDIQEAVQKLAGTHLRDNIELVQCTVASVDLSTRTCDCTPISGVAVTDIPNVQLMAEVDDGFLIIPTVGSTVFVLHSTRHAPYIELFSQIDGVMVIVGNVQLVINGSGIQLGDGSFGGLIQIQQLVEKLNNLENAVTSHIAKFNTHTHAGVQAGAGTTATPIPTDDQNLTLTLQSDLENPLITHGKLLE